MAFEDYIQNPLVQFGARLMAASDPRRQGLGGLGEAVTGTGTMLRQQAQLAEENERARMLADLQVQELQNKLAQPTQPDLSKSPTYVTDEEGNLKILQLSGQGPPVEATLPEGYRPALPLTYQDFGPGIAGYQRGATEPAVVIQKGLTPEAMPETRAQQAVAVQQAKATQEAVEQLPGEEMQFERVSRYIDEIIEHPGLEAGTGLSSLFPVVPGSDRADFEARKNQLLGGVFLQGFQMLKGGGPVTEVEGLKAEQAMARMSTATSKEDFIAAMEDYREALRDGLAKLRKRAGQPMPQNSGKVVDWSEL